MFTSGHAHRPVITGTFIQESLVSDWNDKMWQEELSYMKEAGLKYLIFAVVNEHINGEYVINYPTKVEMLQKFCTGKNLLEDCLRNCKNAGIKVFVGLNASDRWWFFYTLYEDWLFGQMNVGNMLAKDFYQNYKFRYPDTFVGWYWNFELFNMPMFSENCPEHDIYFRRIVHAIDISLDYLTKLDGSMPVILSPFANDNLTSKDDHENFWTNFIRNAHFKSGDILCPQDAVGAGWTSIENLDQWFGSYKKALAGRNDIRLWANNENFDQIDWSSATLDRFIRQLEITDQYAENHITFSYNHYYSPMNIKSGFHKAYLAYINNQALSQTLPPSPRDVACVELDNNAVLLKWDCENMDDIAGFYIYRDGVKIGSCKLHQKVSLGENCFLPEASKHYVDRFMLKSNACYEVKSFNFFGKTSIGAQINFKRA